MSHFSTSPIWSSRTKTIIALIVLTGLLFVVWSMREVLPIVIISIVLAYLMYPVVNVIERRVLFFPLVGKRVWAALLTFVVVLIFISVVLLVIVPVIGDQLQEFGRSLPRLVSGVVSDLEVILAEPLAFNNEPILIEGEPFVPLDQIEIATGTRDLNQLIQLENLNLMNASQVLFGSITSLSGPAFSFLGGAFNTLINVTFLIMMIFYLLKDGGVFTSNILEMVPDDYRSDARRLLQELGQVWNAYLRGQILLCVIIGMAVYIAATLLGLSNAPILGLIAGILEFIPNLGPFLAMIPALFLALVEPSSTLPFLEGLPFMIVVAIVWTMIQNVEAVFIVPRVMGESLNLHPYVVILGVLGGAALAGAIGVILAAPFIASARLALHYIYGKLADQPPFPIREEPPPRVRPPRWWIKVMRWSRRNVPERYRRWLGGSRDQRPDAVQT